MKPDIYIEKLLMVKYFKGHQNALKAMGYE